MTDLDRLIEILCGERGEEVPVLSEDERPDYFRALCNVRPPVQATAEFLSLQDRYLKEKVRQKGVADVDLLSYKDGVCLFRGDITRLNADAIVNAANPAMLGCFHPLHGCIDNAIHSAAGVQVRLDCNDIMKGGQAKVGEVIVTKAYNLPAKFIFHTAGPIVYGKTTRKNQTDLKKCYVGCLEKAAELNLKSVAFCCISTGVYGYPQQEAACVATYAVTRFPAVIGGKLKVIFDLFTENDYEIYKRIIG